MSFRQYGGINYAARNNIVKNNFTNASNLSIMNKVGQPDSKINVESTLDVYAINLTSPTYTLNENGVVPKSYVDLVSVGLTPLQACQCATTGPLSPAGDPSSTVYSTPLVIDDYTVQNNDRVLIKDQPPNSTPYLGSVENGIYDFNNVSGTFTRSSDYTTGTDAYGAYTLVQNGIVNVNKQFIQLNQGQVGTATLLFTTFSSSVLVGPGLLKTSNGSATTIQVDPNLSSPSFINTLAVSGATSLGSLTVSGNGIIMTSAVNTERKIKNVYYQLTDSTNLSVITGEIYASSGIFKYDNNSTNGSHSFAVGDNTNQSIPFYTDATDMSFNTTNFPKCYSTEVLLPTNNSNSVPTCAWVQSAIGNISGTYAPLISPNLTGVPTAPTAAPLTSNTQIATTAYVDSAVSGGGGGSSYWSLDPSNNLFPTAYSTNNLCIGTNTNTTNYKMLVVGNTFLNGSTNIGGAFTVNSFLTTLNNGLTVSGITTLNNGLTVNGSGITTLNTPLSVLGNLELKGTTTTLYSSTPTAPLIIQGPPVTSTYGVEIWVNGGGSGSCITVVPTGSTTALITLTKPTITSSSLTANGILSTNAGIIGPTTSLTYTSDMIGYTVKQYGTVSNFTTISGSSNIYSVAPSSPVYLNVGVWIISMYANFQPPLQFGTLLFATTGISNNTTSYVGGTGALAICGSADITANSNSRVVGGITETIVVLSLSPYYQLVNITYTQTSLFTCLATQCFFTATRIG